MNEKAWSDFEKTGSVADYLNYKLSAADSPVFRRSRSISSAAELPVGAVRAEMPRGAGAYRRRPLRTAGRLNNADKNKGDSSSGTGL